MTEPQIKALKSLVRSYNKRKYRRLDKMKARMIQERCIDPYLKNNPQPFHK